MKTSILKSFSIVEEAAKFPSNNVDTMRALGNSLIIMIVGDWGGKALSLERG
jgi:hypothetical protein